MFNGPLMELWKWHAAVQTHRLSRGNTIKVTQTRELALMLWSWNELFIWKWRRSLLLGWPFFGDCSAGVMQARLDVPSSEPWHQWQAWPGTRHGSDRDWSDLEPCRFVQGNGAGYRKQDHLPETPMVPHHWLGWSKRGKPAAVRHTRVKRNKYSSCEEWPPPFQLKYLCGTTLLYLSALVRCVLWTLKLHAKRSSFSKECVDLWYHFVVATAICTNCRKSRSKAHDVDESDQRPYQHKVCSRARPANAFILTCTMQQHDRLLNRFVCYSND